MNIAVVDDEEIIRQQIHGFIKKQKPEFYISDFATGEELLAAKADFDIIFLDIQMEGMGGIEAARSLRKKNMDAVLVFITGMKEYVFEAFDVSAFHYLLKPIGEKKFMEVLGRAVDEAGRRKGQKEQQISELEKQGYEQLSAQNKALGGTVTYYQQTWMVNKDGSIQSTVYSVTETGMTNAERMKKNMDERLEKQKEKKEEEEKVQERKEEKAEQAEKLDGDTEKISVPEAAGQKITVKYVEAESESEAKAMMQKEKLEDTCYPKFDMNV